MDSQHDRKGRKERTASTMGGKKRKRRAEHAKKKNQRINSGIKDAKTLKVLTTAVL